MDQVWRGLQHGYTQLPTLCDLTRIDQVGSAFIAYVKQFDRSRAVYLSSVTKLWTEAMQQTDGKIRFNWRRGRCKWRGEAMSNCLISHNCQGLSAIKASPISFQQEATTATSSDRPPAQHAPNVRLPNRRTEEEEDQHPETFWCWDIRETFPTQRRYAIYVTPVGYFIVLWRESLRLVRSELRRNGTESECVGASDKEILVLYMDINLLNTNRRLLYL